MNADGPSLSLSALKQIDVICDRFEEAWLAEKRPRIEEHLSSVAETALPALLRALLSVELDCRSKRGERPAVVEYERRFPRHQELIRDVFTPSTAEHSLADTSVPHPVMEPATTYSLRADDGGIVIPLDKHGGRRLDATFDSGVLLDGRYRLQHELGRGGMGLVFLGRDHRLDRLVAVKVVLPPRRSDEEYGLAVRQERFMEEARLGANLIHPAIAGVFDYGFHQGLPYAVFEYVSGATLREVMRKRRAMPLEDVRLILGPLAQALDFAHQRHVVHRDLKPENIRATEQEQFKILDPGLAKRFDEKRASWRFAGTPAYAAPEQATEEPSDGRTDQYALAVVVYEMLTGRRPFTSGSASELLEMHRTQTPQSPKRWVPGLPDSVCAAILKALSKNPDHRFADCEDFATAIGCQLLSQSVALPEARLEADVSIPRSPFSLAWSSELRGVRLLLLPEALWTHRLGQIRCWPMRSITAVRRSSLRKRLILTTRSLRGQVRQTWAFRSRKQCNLWYAKLKAGTSGAGSAVAGDPERKLVALLPQRPNVRVQVLGQVESTQPKRKNAERSLLLQGAVAGADAVVDLERERVYGPRKRLWRITGKAVKAVDRRGAHEMGVRWSAGAISRAAASSLYLAGVLLLLIGLGLLTPRLLPPEQLGVAFPSIPALGPILLVVEDLAAGLGGQMLLCLVWPLLLCVVLQWLKWPQLVRPTVFALLACAAAPLLGKLAGTLLAGMRPRDWYSQLIVFGEMAGLLLIAYWIAVAAWRLWETDRKTRHLFRLGGSPTRTGFAVAATLITAFYGICLLLGMTSLSYYRVQGLLGAPDRNIAWSLINERFRDLTEKQCVGQLSSDSPRNRTSALLQLVEYGNRARRETIVGDSRTRETIEAVTKCLTDEDPGVRGAACFALEAYGKLAVRAAGPLSRCLEDTDPKVRTVAMQALERISEGWRRGDLRAAVPPLVRRIPNAGNAERQRLFAILVQIDRHWYETEAARNAVVSMAGRLETSDSAKRLEAIALLQQFGSGGRSAIGPLAMCLADPDEQVRESAVRALDRIDRQWRESEAARRTGAAFAERLQSEDATEQMQAMAALKTLRRGGQPALEALVRCLVDDDERVREEAAVVLAGIDFRWFENEAGRKAIPRLIRGLSRIALPIQNRSNSWTERISQVLSSDAVYTAAAVEALTASLTDDEPVVRRAAVEALGKFGAAAQGALGPLIERLADTDDFTSNEARRTLDRLDRDWRASDSRKKVLPNLIEKLAAEQADRRAAAARAIGSVGPPAASAVPALAPMLNDSEEEVRMEALGSLRRMGQLAKSAVPALLKLRSELPEDSQLRPQVERTLGEIGWRPPVSEKEE